LTSFGKHFCRFVVVSFLRPFKIESGPGKFERQVRPRRPFAQTALELEIWLLYEEQQRFWSSMINLTYVLSSCD
jgi:hypothetical protein